MSDHPYSWHDEALGISVDTGRMGLDGAFVAALAAPFATAFSVMGELERGAIANPDEARRVGHYWLRAPQLAPEAELRDKIVDTVAEVERLAEAARAGTLAGDTTHRAVLVVGIGGSALGPQLVCDALGDRSGSGLPVRFSDNTDPDGIDRVIGGLSELGGLGHTLCLVISKSGGTKETRNSMLELDHAYRQAGLDLARHAVAITGRGSQLDTFAHQRGFLARVPMWDWVGGRTSVTSAVGLLPAALGGVDVRALLAGAAAMDTLTRAEAVVDNPAALLAASWHAAGDGRGSRAMVVLPYKDRLALFARYLQQLVMESLGKRESLTGEIVEQGLTVFGNKGSTDQHAYVQQLLDGPDTFFTTFIEVLRDRAGESIEVEPGVTSGDYLSGFLQGTRRALHERGRRSLTITLNELDAKRLGALLALYERAVGLYALLVGINAYHQPAVESGKRAAAEVLAVQRKVLEQLSADGQSAETIAAATGSDAETVFCILRHLAANGRAARQLDDGADPWTARYASASQNETRSG